MARKGERDPERERFWRAVVQKHQLSELTAKEFCRRENISEASYYAWRRKLARPDRERDHIHGISARHLTRDR